MIITRTSMLTQKVHEMDLPVTEEQLQAWRNGKMVQDAMPHLNADQREFIISGITPEEWKQYMGDE